MTVCSFGTCMFLLSCIIACFVLLNKYCFLLSYIKVLYKGGSFKS